MRDCIGCGVCITHCPEDVLGIVDDKALVNLDTVDACTACGDCERVCPVDVVTLRNGTEPAAVSE